MKKILVGFSKKDYPNVIKFSDLGECKFLRYDREYLLNNIQQYEIVIPHLFEYIDNEIIQNAKNLKLIATPSTGKDHIDQNALDKKGIKLISLNEDRSFINEITSTAEMSWLLTLSCMRNVRQLIDRIQIDKSWSNTDIRGYELNNKTLGIIGYGRLGRMVGNYGIAFGMKVIAYDINQKKYDEKIMPVSLEELYKMSDVISLHPKLNKTSYKMINKEAIKQMKPGVIIINTSRGSIIDSSAIIKGLDTGKISSVGIDVCNNEYESAELPKDPIIARSLLDKRIIITPHSGGSTHDAHGKVFGKIAELVKIYLQN